MMCSQSESDELIAKSPIEEIVSQYVTLHQCGHHLFGRCPFHKEMTASFSVAPDKGIYHCFGCKRTGNVVHFIMEIERLSYSDALRVLAQRAEPESAVCNTADDIL